MDGGGMRGIVTVRMLRELEARTGRSVYDMFDLIGGTSTGGILAVALGVKEFTLQQCDDLYSKLGRKVSARCR
jgi:patatin-like phospholipase/acyl hydrolase